MRHVAAHDGFVLALHAVQRPAVHVPEQVISLQVHHTGTNRINSKVELSKGAKQLINKERKRETGRQTDKQTERQTDRKKF